MATTPPHIVFAEPYESDAIEKARAVGRVAVLKSCDEGALIGAVRDCDALLVRSHAKVTQRVLKRAARLRVIGRGGTGLDNIDLDAARECGITVVHTPGAATDAAADLTVGLMISLIRQVNTADRMVREGRFADARERCLGVELGGLTLGIVGLGRIGRAVARRGRNGFGMTVLYNDIVDVGPLDFEATPLEKQELYCQADVISLHVPLTDLTRGLINDETLTHFKAGAFLINASRGAVVDSHALARALTDGSLAGAALDVFDPEPLPENHPLMTAPNTLFTAHMGARTHASLAGMNAVIDDVLAVLQGKPPAHPA